MANPDKRRFRATRSELTAMRDFVELSCAKLPGDYTQRLVLIAEELFCNTIEHGYRRDCSEPVWLDLAPTTHGCTLVYEDSAPPHDPFATIKGPRHLEHTGNLPVGGLGVFLIGQLCTLKRYERRDDRNVIELYVPLAGAPSVAKAS